MGGTSIYKLFHRGEICIFVCVEEGNRQNDISSRVGRMFRHKADIFEMSLLDQVRTDMKGTCIGLHIHIFAVAKYRRVKIARASIVNDILAKKGEFKFQELIVKRASNKSLDAAAEYLITS